jgi:photosystem II stability/assembly factor-like uncharacterized protein
MGQNNFTLFVGTVGRSLYVSPDGGRNWHRPVAIHADECVYEVQADPKNPDVIYVGSEEGIYKSVDHGKTFKHMDSVLNGKWVWRIAVDPVDTNIVYAGTKPPFVYRSQDAGKSWEKTSCQFNEMFPAPKQVRDFNRVLGLAVDPTNHRVVWASVEADGVQRSQDGGDTWEKVEFPLATGLTPSSPPDRILDTHDIVVSSLAPKKVVLTLSQDVIVTTDEGKSWRFVPGGGKQWSPLPNVRNMAAAENGKVIYVGCSDGSPMGVSGGVRRSTDGGESWESLELPRPARAPMFGLATHPLLPGVVAAGSRYGEIFVSKDGGDWWVELPRLFSELRRGLAVSPN